MNVFVTADTHFLHDNIIAYCHRPFTPENMTAELVSRWNAVVGETDLVIHLGDFGFVRGGSEKLVEISASLNGRKVLIRGNHDSKSKTWYLEHGFEFVCDSFVLGDVLFTHWPAEIDLMKQYRLNVHGHTHDKSTDYLKPKKKYVCVSVEKTEYAPVLLEDVLTGKFA